MRRALALAGVLAAGVAGCGGSGSSKSSGQATSRTTTIERTRVVIPSGKGSGFAGFDPPTIYRQEALGVVTVISVFGGGATSLFGGGGGGAAEGSGFVVSAKGEILTNAHVVTNGTGASIKRAKNVYVDFSDGNRVPARIVGVDPNSDIALLDVDPTGLSLTTLPLGASHGLIIGSPVAAIGSPFGEPQSLSVGVISALDRSIESLTSFQISGAIQTDAAINHGNSGGPLVNAKGEVLGINSQIRSTGGGGEGVGFAVPVDTVRRSLGQLRTKGHVDYAYLGVSTTEIYPQLAEHFHLPVKHGVWIQQVTKGGPAAKAGLKGGTRTERFQIESYRAGGEIITKVNGHPIVKADDLGSVIARFQPGQTVTLEIYRGSSRSTVRLKLGSRPAGQPVTG